MYFSFFIPLLLSSSAPSTSWLLLCVCVFLRFYLFIFRERGKEEKREGEKYPCVVTSSTPPTGHLAHNPGKCPDWDSNPRLFGSQAGTQSTGPQQVGLYC